MYFRVNMEGFWMFPIDIISHVNDSKKHNFHMKLDYENIKKFRIRC